MTWTITYTSGDVVLPYNPERVDLREKAIVTSLEIPTELPFILGIGKEGQELHIQGRLLSNADLDALRYMVFQVVTLATHDALYDGQWIVTEFTWSEESGVPNVYVYNMSFLKGSEMLTLA